MEINERPAERVGRGIIGALLFSPAGGIIYYVLRSVNIISAISGIICVICALKGYELFAGARTKRGIFISVAVSAVMLIPAWYFCFCADMRAYWQAAFEAGEIDFIPSMVFCLRYGYPDIPAKPTFDVLRSNAKGLRQKNSNKKPRSIN